MTAGLELDFAAQLYASMNGLAGQLDRREQRIAQLAEGVQALECHAISFTGADVPYAPKQWGPTSGFTWFVQLVTVGPLGSGDILAVYRGRSTADNEPQRKKNEFVGTAGAVQVWHPGRVGLRLAGNCDGLVFDGGTGTLTTATRYWVNVDVIQVADACLGPFLL